MKKIIITFMVMLLSLCSINTFAYDDIVSMYSREDGAPIWVYRHETAQYAANYANSDEKVTMYSRDDGAKIKVWASEVQSQEFYYATGRQAINMFSKEDGAQIKVWAYDIPYYTYCYYGERTKVTMYSRTDLEQITVWGSEVQGNRGGYLLGSDKVTMYSMYDGAAVTLYANEAVNTEDYIMPYDVCYMYSKYDGEEIAVYGYQIRSLMKNYYAPYQAWTGFINQESDFKFKAQYCSFNELSRYPDSYYGTKVCLYGEVIQVIETSQGTNYRVNITYHSDGYYGYYTDTVYVHSAKLNTDPRILVDDYICIYGVSLGLTSYESIFGETITLPYIEAKYLEL